MISEQELRQLDMRITTRNRGTRRLMAFLAPVLLLGIAVLFGVALAAIVDIPTWFGQLAGLAGGSIAGVWAFSRSWITNTTTSACITHDVIQSFLGQDPLVYYGPGTHAAYFWEERKRGNTVFIGEVTEPFTTEVQLAKGKLKFSGSIRFRADITQLGKFVSGAGAIASDIKGLVAAHILKEVGGDERPIKEVLRIAETLNPSLERSFKHGNGNPISEDFEGRFGLIVGDVTVEKVEAEGIEETLNALSEAAIIDQIVANAFGCKDTAELQQKVEGGKVDPKDVRHYRNTVLAHSGNLQGMKLEEITHNFNVSGIDPGVTSAFLAAVPAALNAAKQVGGAKGGRGKPKGEKS
jgi:hypothetical protein